MKLGKFLRTSTFQLALIYMVLFSSSVLVLFWVFYWASAGHMARQTDATIQAEITGLAEQYRRRGLQGLVDVISDRMANDPQSSSLYLFARADYTPLAGNLRRWPDGGSESEGWLSFRHQDRAGNPVQARARLFLLRGGFRLLVGRDMREVRAAEQLFLRAVTWGLLGSIGLSILGGLLMSRSVVRRIDTINQTSHAIMTGDLSQRMPELGTGDEFDRLAANLNAMLDQIEVLMAGVRHVANSVAHDLRTPLTRLRTRLDELKRQPGFDKAQRGNIEDCLAEADRLLGTFNALLRIARIEAGSHVVVLSRVDLDELVRDAAELYEALADERGIGLTVGEQLPVSVRGDRDLLFQALSNLLDNAIKYTPPGGLIRLEAERVATEVILVVADTGPGVPAAERDKVLERFYRLDDSGAVSGSGLGLSLVQAVAILHDAALELDDNRPGLKVTLRFPG